MLLAKVLPNSVADVAPLHSAMEAAFGGGAGGDGGAGRSLEGGGWARGEGGHGEVTLVDVGVGFDVRRHTIGMGEEEEAGGEGVGWGGEGAGGVGLYACGIFFPLGFSRRRFGC